MAKLEKILAVLFGIGLLLHVLRLDGGAIITLLGGMALSILYWPLGFALLNGVRGRELFSGAAYRHRTAGQFILAAILSLLLATAIIGTVFYVLRWDGAYFLRFVAGIGLVLTLAMVLALRQRLALPFGGTGWLIRGALALSLLAALGIMPSGSTTAVPPAPTTR